MAMGSLPPGLTTLLTTLSDNPRKPRVAHSGLQVYFGLPEPGVFAFRIGPGAGCRPGPARPPLRGLSERLKTILVRWS